MSARLFGVATRDEERGAVDLRRRRRGPTICRVRRETRLRPERRGIEGQGERGEYSRVTKACALVHDSSGYAAVTEYIRRAGLDSAIASVRGKLRVALTDGIRSGQRSGRGEMQTPRWSLAVLIAVGLSLAVPATGHSQLGSLKKKAEEAAKKKLEEATKKASADSAKAKAAADSAKAKSADPAQTGAAAAGAGAGASAAKADPKIWDNYDFVPGNKVIFYHRLQSEDKVGNFARGLKFSSRPDGCRGARRHQGASRDGPVGIPHPGRQAAARALHARDRRHRAAGHVLRLRGRSRSRAARLGTAATNRPRSTGIPTAP